jgi:hypothetical protein
LLVTDGGVNLSLGIANLAHRQGLCHLAITLLFGHLPTPILILLTSLRIGVALLILIAHFTRFSEGLIVTILIFMGKLF